MSKKFIYKITLTNWQKHNEKHKNTYKKVMLKANFCTDAKVRALSMNERWVFLNLIVACSDLARDTVELSSNQLRDMLECNRNIDGVLDHLQSLQILSYTKVASKEVKKEEKEEKEGIPRGEKTKKQKPTQVEFVDADASPPVESNIGQKLIGIYCTAWKSRYKSNPPLRKQDTRNLKDFGIQNGFDRSRDLLNAYISMNERWFLQKRHDLQTFLNNTTSVAHFLQTGRVITNQDLKNIDRAVSNRNTLDALENGEI